MIILINNNIIIRHLNVYIMFLNVYIIFLHLSTFMRSGLQCALVRCSAGVRFVIDILYIINIYRHVRERYFLSCAFHSLLTPRCGAINQAWIGIENIVGRVKLI